MVRIAAAVLVLLLMVPGARGEDEERPRIFLEKKIFSETSEGGKSFYEVHTVSKGENLWKILKEKSPIFPADYSSLLREFRRANPDVKNPDRLFPGRKIFVPAGTGMKTARMMESGEIVAYRVRKGDTLSEILTAQGVVRKDLPDFLAAVKDLNDSVRDVNVIFAGKSILVPTGKYFEKAEAVAEAPVSAPGPLAASAPPPPPEKEPAAGKSLVALTEDVPPPPGADGLSPAKPESQVTVSAPPPAESAAVITGQKTREPSLPPPPPAKPAYRGLLSDMVRGLGEKWIDQGTLYLPIPSGGEVVLNLDEYPVVRFSGGIHALIDFGGALPEEVRGVITETWTNYRVVSMDGAQGALDVIGRLLGASGYHSVREGFASPPVIGEEISVTLPARWVVLRTPQSLLSGEIFLVKEVPEKPGPGLSAVIRYAERVGIRVLAFAYDPSAYEGFLVGLPPAQGNAEEPSEVRLPEGGLEALDVSLDLLGIPKLDEKRIRIGGGKEAFTLTVQPDRMFEAGGKQFVVDAGSMSPALRSILRNSGYVVFPLDRNESGDAIFRRVLDAAGIPVEARKGLLLAGGKEEGFEVRASGTFVTSRDWLESRQIREMVLVRERAHSATRMLMKELGVELVGR